MQAISKKDMTTVSGGAIIIGGGSINWSGKKAPNRGQCSFSGC